jgi:hypothetical protein
MLGPAVQNQVRMLVRHSVTVLMLAVAMAVLAPSRALAHAGLSAPVASSYQAEVAQTPPGIEAKVVDGDQRLWLRAAPSLTVVVTGLRGEPYLRFAPSGVWENQSSPTTYLNKPRPQVPPHGAVPGAPPRWKRVSTGHSFQWHEDRLHSLAATARSGAARFVGTWTVPLTVGGKQGHITGGLSYKPNPSILWFWPLVVLTVCCGLLLRMKSPRVDGVMALVLGATTLVAIIVARAGRGLFGRPDISTGGVIEFGAYAAIALAGLCLLAFPRRRDTGVAIAAVVGFAVGVGLIPVLTRGFVLSALPDTLQRVAVSLTLAGCVSCLLVLVLGQRTRAKAKS